MVIKRQNKHKGTDFATTVLDIYIAPLLLLSFGVVMVMVGFTLRIPKGDDLSEVRGHLDSYYHKQTGRGQGDYTTIVLLEEGPRFWTNAVTKDSAAKVFSEQGAELRFYVEPNSTNVPIDGAIKSYGLWIRGEQIESLEHSLGHESFIVRFGFPAIGLLSITSAILIYRRNRAKYGSYRRSPPQELT